MKLLEKHFDLAFTAPNGVQKLRELILTFAIQGKLVRQDPNDQPARELLKEIEAEKEKLVKEGRIKQLNPLPHIRPNEVPHSLPQGWQWIRFGEITINRDSERIPVSKEERQKIIGEYDYYGASGVIDKVNNFLFDTDLLLIGEDGANLINRSTPIAFIACGKYWVNNHAHVIDAVHFDMLLYLEKYINAIDLKPYVTGSAQPKMNQTKMNSIVIGLPPLAEQRRIVAKIDRLMAQCDELEKLRGDRNQKRITIHTAALNRLLTTKESNDFSTAWRFITKHFGELYSVKENVTELRKAILQLAVMGKLVPQDPKDEPANELLKAIETEKQHLLEQGKIKQPKPLPDIKSEDVPHTLPSGWVWVRLGNITSLQNGFAFKSTDYTPHGVKLIRNVNISHGFVDHKDIAYYPDSERTRFEDFELSQGDILISLDRPIISTGLKIAILGEQDVPSLLVQRVGRVRSAVLKVKPSFLFNWFNSSLFIDRIAPGRSNGVPHISTKEVEMLLFPLPPLSEQHRIVTKIDQLMVLCDYLEQQIDAATNKQNVLLNAVMAQV